MLIGVPKEIKVHQYRVGLTPDSVREFAVHGHKVVVETGAGAGIGRTDEDYRTAGAEIAGDAKAVFDRAEMIVKVKEPQASERRMLRDGQILFTYLHLAADRSSADLVASGATCIAYETVTDGKGFAAAGADVAGCGPTVDPGGGALPGTGARRRRHPARRRARRGAGESRGDWRRRGRRQRDHDGARHGCRRHRARPERRRAAGLARRFGPALKTIYSTRASLLEYVLEADMVVGAVLVVGAEAPKLVTAEMVKRMKPGSVLVDVAIDQGGCFETSRPTTHADPTYVIDGVVHYCVANMPGAVPRTSTYALNNVTLPYALALADRGARQALLDNPNFLQGLNVCRGQVTYQAVANDLGYEFVDPAKALALKAQRTHPAGLLPPIAFLDSVCGMLNYDGGPDTGSD